MNGYLIDFSLITIYIIITVACIRTVKKIKRDEDDFDFDNVEFLKNKYRVLKKRK